MRQRELRYGPEAWLLTKVTEKGINANIILAYAMEFSIYFQTHD